VILLKINGVKRDFTRPFWDYFRKHYCPFCRSLLKTVKVSRIVNSESAEAENFVFENYMTGNIKFIWTEFRCPSCDKGFTYSEVRANEKNISKL